MRGMCRQNAKTIYIKENYYKLREENPGMSVQELFSSIHRKFSQVSNEEKVLSAMGSFKINDLSIYIVFVSFSAMKEM